MGALALVGLFLFSLSPGVLAKDLRTKEQRLYDIQLRKEQWKVDRAKLDMDDKQSTYEETRDLFDQKIRTLEELNRDERLYQQTRLKYQQAVIGLEKTRLSFLRDATHIAVREARKYRLSDGRRQVEIVLENASNLNQALSLNPKKTPEEVRALLEIQNILVSIRKPDGQKLIVAEPYEIPVPALRLGERKTLTFRLLSDYQSVRVSLDMPDGTSEDIHIVLRQESLQDLPTINSVQFSQEGDLNSRVNYDLILERLAQNEKTFRLALVNLPAEIDPAFLDPATGARLTQVKFSEENTRQQLELEVQIPERLSRRFVDHTIEFYVFITDQKGFRHLGRLKRKYGDRAIPLEEVNTIEGNKERFELIPRGKGALEILISNRYQEIKTGQSVVVRVELLNTGTIEVENAHLVLTPPLDWSASTAPDTLARVLPGEKEPVNITLKPPADLGVSEYDVRIEAAGFVGNEKVEAQEKEITIRVEARARVLRNALIIGGVIALVVGIAIVSIKVSRR